MSSPSPVPISLLAGPQIIGYGLSWALQGVLTVQVYLYYRWFPGDSIGNKCLVYGIFIYECVQMALATDFAFTTFVYGFGNLEALVGLHNSWFSVTIMSSIISGVVQGYYVRRIYLLGRSFTLTAIIVVLALFQTSIGIAGGVMLHLVDPTAAEASRVTPIVSARLGGAACVDIIIAVAMTILLLRAKSGFRRSDDMVNRLVIFSVETGAMTATVAIVDLVCFAALPQTLLHECAAVILVKLYPNTLLASLNNRAFLRASNPGIALDIPLNTLSLNFRDHHSTSIPGTQNERTTTGVQVHISCDDTLIIRDGDSERNPSEGAGKDTKTPSLTDGECPGKHFAV